MFPVEPYLPLPDTKCKIDLHAISQLFSFLRCFVRIAILDPRIQAPGLIKLFPEADYFVISHGVNIYDLDKTPDRFNRLYGFRYRKDLETITGNNYDMLFIVYACFDFRDKKRQDVQFHLGKLLEIISRSDFEKIIGFSNDDCSFDPAVECDYLRASIWFKRNYQTTTKYSCNVYPFPFFMFGQICPLWRILTETYSNPEKIDRVLWAGSITKRSDPNRNKDYLSRRTLFKSRLRKYLTTVKVPNHLYMQELSRSLFALDMNGEGDPNYRTFEILMTDALLIQQRKHLVWPFDSSDYFSEETIYRTPEEFIEKLTQLRADTTLYNHCLANQKYLKAKYFTQEWLRSYLLRHISPPPHQADVPSTVAFHAASNTSVFSSNR
jgi:hypothetical protein